MDKDDKDIRKEIEELEKLIEQVKKQNEEEKKKHKNLQKANRPMVIKINLAMEYSANFYLNLLISFAVNFLVILLLLNIFNFAYVSDIIYVVLISLILTLFEELSRKYLARKFLAVVVYSSGLVYYLANLLLFYFLDLAIFGNNFYFNSHWDPIIFVMFLHFIRMIVRVFYLRIFRNISLRTMKKRR